MNFWFWNGVRHGIRTTAYPARPEPAPGVTPGRPLAVTFGAPEAAAELAALCPVGAITAVGRRAAVEFAHCVHCQRCRASHRPARAAALDWRLDYEWTGAAGGRRPEPLPRAFRRSLHLMVVDAGDCGACLHELRQLNNPLYNMHRLGFFFTATPRAADVLLVAGPVTENMRLPLRKVYEAMPEPKRVLAVGSCALNGGVFGRGFMSVGGAAAVVPVDGEVPGNPPPPLAILDALLRLAGRAMAAEAGAGRRG